MRQYEVLKWLVWAIILMSPSAVLANAGTPLMWAGMGHLVLGNAIIGLIEGILLIWWFKASSGWTVGRMILANYVSAWSGLFVLLSGSLNWVPMDLNNVRFWVCLLIVAMVLLTLLIEWPFVAWALKGGGTGLVLRSLKANFVIHLVSYLMLGGWYFLASQTSLLNLQVVDPKELALPENVQVYYIAQEDGKVYHRPLRGGLAQSIVSPVSNDRADTLAIRSDETNLGYWTLLLVQFQDNKDHPTILLNALSQKLVPVWPDWPKDGSPMNSWGAWGWAGILGDRPANTRRFSSGFWASDGLEAKAGDTWPAFNVAFETPVGQWSVRNVFDLPNDMVFFQLGEDQLCVLDPATMRITLLWRGRGAVCMLSDSPEKSN